MKWFDVGANLTDPRLSDHKVLLQALDANVLKIAITGTDVASSQQALTMCQSHPEHLLCTAGVHPHYSKDADANYIEQLRHLSAQAHVVAIGECGLDFNRNFSPVDTQLKVFEEQLALAVESGLPVFLHERDAFEQQYALLKQYMPRLVGGIAHCFTGTPEQMHAYLDLGLYIGITGWVCDEKRGQSLREAVNALPLERMVLETDAPYLLPKFLRTHENKRDNFPANLPPIANFIAELKGIEVNELADQCWQNSCQVLQLDQQGNPCARK